MTAEPHPVHKTINDAIEEHGSALDVTVPAFGAVLAGHQQRSRRMVAAATVLVALVGIGGVVVATNRTQDPGNAVSEGLDDPTTDEVPVETTDAAGSVRSAPATTSPTAATPTEYFCTDPLGEDQLGRSLFGSCVPAPDQTTSDFACTDRIGTDDTGRVRFSTCVAIGQLGPLPDDDGDAPFDNPDDIPVRSTPYVVQPGDYGIKIADQFCVSTADLEAVNGWLDVSRDFPAPDSQILIPQVTDDDPEGCGAELYTVLEGDTVRSEVADKLCVSVEALDEANRGTDGYSSFFPGLVIVVPQSSEQAC